jgi:hypothetical protein
MARGCPLGGTRSRQSRGRQGEKRELMRYATLGVTGWQERISREVRVYGFGESKPVC